MMGRGAARIAAALMLTASMTVFDTSVLSAKTKFSLLYTFTGGRDGALLFTALTPDPSGRIVYGTTGGGGASRCSGETIDGGCGVVFSLTRTSSGPWREKVLHFFTGGRDGLVPNFVQFLDGSSTLYGVTEAGGKQNCNAGCGTVFTLTPMGGNDWTKTTIYEFKGATSDGSYPYSSLVLGADGAIYGTTIFGGNAPEGGPCFSFRSGCGTIYKLTAPASGTEWRPSLPHTFTGGTDGAMPQAAGLTTGPDGAFYGTTQAGGNANCQSPFQAAQRGCGTIYRLEEHAPGSRRWNFTVLHAFKGGRNDGLVPEQDKLAIDEAGNIYGTTVFGGAHNEGTIFRLSPPVTGKRWTFTLLYSFAGRGDGGQPFGGLLLKDGVLYGTASVGGDRTSCSGGCGTVFSFTPGDAAPKTLHAFNGTDGRTPTAHLAAVGNTFFGITRNGGDTTACTDTFQNPSGCGTVFSISP